MFRDRGGWREKKTVATIAVKTFISRGRQGREKQERLLVAVDRFELSTPRI